MIYLRGFQAACTCFCVGCGISEFMQGKSIVFCLGGSLVCMLYLITGLIDDHRERERDRCRKILEEIGHGSQSRDDNDIRI